MIGCLRTRVVSASSQSLRFILSLRMNKSFITSRPGSISSCLCAGVVEIYGAVWISTSWSTMRCIMVALACCIRDWSSTHPKCCSKVLTLLVRLKSPVTKTAALLFTDSILDIWTWLMDPILLQYSSCVGTRDL